MRISDCYRAFPRQNSFTAAVRSTAFLRRAGPGKTKALLGKRFPGAVRAASDCLLRRTYPELESSLLAYFRRDVPRKFYRSYKNRSTSSVGTMDRRRALVLPQRK